MAAPLVDIEKGRKNSIRLKNALRPLPMTCDLILDYSDRESTVSSDIHDPFTDEDDEDDESDKVHSRPESEESLRLQYLKRVILVLFIFLVLNSEKTDFSWISAPQ